MGWLTLHLAAGSDTGSVCATSACNLAPVRALSKHVVGFQEDICSLLVVCGSCAHILSHPVIFATVGESEGYMCVWSIEANTQLL
jgi:hypothetical protein